MVISKDKRSMMLSLPAAEMAVVEALAKKRGLTKTGLVRQAIRLYESVDTRMDQGHKLYVENPEKQDKLEIMLL